MQGKRKKLTLTVGQLSERLDAELAGPGSAKISGVNAIEAAGRGDVTFLLDRKHIAKLAASKAAAVIVGEKIESLDKPQLVVKNVDAALIKALNIFVAPFESPPAGLHPSAIIAEDAQIHPSASIGPAVVIENGVQIGPGTTIAAGCKIGPDCRIGRNCRLDANVVVYHNCRLENNVVIQANTAIGSCGFGYAIIEGAPRLIPHSGGVIIEDCVEIGANCCVDRAKFGNTVIGAGTKIDNLVQIGHNVTIGKCCLIVAQVGIGGSSEIGGNVILAGQVGVADNVKIGDGTVVAAQAGVSHNLSSEGKYLGSPAIEAGQAIKLITLTKRLPKMLEQLRNLAKRVEKLEAAKNDTH